MRKFTILALVALATASASAVQGTISTEANSSTGEIKWQSRTKQYIVSLKKGSTMVDIEIKLADVVSLDVAKPAALDKAIAQVEAGQGSSAIGALKKIVDDYRMLKWDRPAARYLALAYLATGDAKKAYDVCQGVIGDDKSAAYSGEMAPAYWKALLKLGKRTELDTLVKKAISQGDRKSSAAAFTMRGDMIVADTNGSSDGLEQALRDGYMRVVLMYNDPECASERAEAMAKAADCFDKRGQAGRAEKLRSQAKAM